MKKAKTKALLMAALMVCGLPLQVNAGQLEVETSDVITVVNNCVPYLIGFAVVVVIAIVISILARKQEARKRTQAKLHILRM